MKNALALLVALATGGLLHSAPPGLTSVPFSTSNVQFVGGDSITITDVLASSPQMTVGDWLVVRGNYTLASQPRASLSIFLTSSAPSVPGTSTAVNTKSIVAGSGSFELEYEIRQPGDLHVSFYAVTGNGASFGGVYFAPPKSGTPVTPVVTNPTTPTFYPQPVISTDGLTEVPFTTSQAQFAAGDSIALQKVFASSPNMQPGDRVVVRGSYQLASQATAILQVALTENAPGSRTLVARNAFMTGTAGSGTFELEYLIQQPGSLHVSFYPAAGGSSFGGLYFAPPGGTQTTIALSNPIANTGRFANLSTRSFVGPGDGSLVTGIVVSEQERYVLIRAVGPTLGVFGVSGTLRKPVITVYNTSNEVVATASSWSTMFSTTQRSGIDMLSRSVGAFPLASGSDDAVLHLRLTPGAYTVVVSSGDGQSGVALMEVYATSTFTLPNN